MKSEAIAQLREMAVAGKTRQECADAFGCSYLTVRNVAAVNGIQFIHASKRGSPNARAHAMVAMYKAGKTLVEIGAIYGVTRERVRQVITKHFGKLAAEGGQSARAKVAAAKRRSARDAAYLAKHGCTFDQMREMRAYCRKLRAEGATTYGTPLTAFRSQRNNANYRGIPWRITFWEWWTFWQASGKWERRGRTRDEYVMCRFGDVGAYELGNVYIATQSHNCTVQPNNPYRVGHPRHAEVMQQLRAAA